jgi:ribosome-associated translation inhibitor RaiA
MEYSDKRYHLHVQFEAKEYQIPPDELERMEHSLEPVGIAVEEFPGSDLRIKVVYHPARQEYHVEAKLKMPGRTIQTGDWDTYLDVAFQRVVRKLTRKAENYRDHPDQRAVELAEQRAEIEQALLVPEDPYAGPLGEAVAAGDYRDFRNRLSPYDDWLNRRAGRWVQRFPEAEARLRRDFVISDLVEEVYLNAFERFAHRPTDVAFHEWLDSLLDPSLKMLLAHPDEETENARMAEVLRETPSA